MPRSVSLHTMEEIDEEISRLRESEHVRLYEKYVRLMNRRRAYMNPLRFEERKGRELAAKAESEDVQYVVSLIPEDDPEEEPALIFSRLRSELAKELLG